MIQNYKRDSLRQGSKFGNITKRKDKFIMKNINDNWEEHLSEMLMKLQVCSQETVHASFLNSQIF